MTELPRTLFAGTGRGAVCWYRCALPAIHLGADWVGVGGEPGDLRTLTGTPKLGLREQNWTGYDVVVLQQPRGKAWLRRIRALQDAGVVVLFEVDDYVHAVRKSRDHDFRDEFGKDLLRELELAMAACDGLIASTPWLANRYRAFNPNAYVCRNGLDLARYALTRPAREHVTLGWTGATGHKESVRPWLDVVAQVMRARPDTRFVSIGQPFAKRLAAEFGDERCLAIPFTSLDTYPAAMTSIDVALAPAGRSNFFRGKSDLRFLEAGALRQAVVGDPTVYPTIEHGVTGLHAETPEEALPQLLELAGDRALRERLGDAARAYVERERDMRVACRQWAAVLRDVTGRPAQAGVPVPRVTAAV